MIKNKFFIILAVFCAGCCVGPDFKVPDAPKVTGYTSRPLPEKTVAAGISAGQAQQFMPDKTLPARWWEEFRCEKLNKLIIRALANNPTLANAQGALREAQENVNVQFGSVIYPDISAAASSTRRKVSPAAGGVSTDESKTYDLHNAAVNLSYLFDIFGGGRRELEALRAKVDYQGFKLKAARIALAANIVNTAVEEAALRTQIASISGMIAAQDKQLKMLEQQFELGGVARSNVLLQRARLEENRALLPPLEKTLALNRHRLAVLTGNFPGEENTLPEFTMDDFTLPLELPITMPSVFVRGRPDIMASQGLLHAACAKVGVATADMYPQIVLSAGYGSQTNTVKNLFESNKDVWSLGYAVAGPVLDGGARRARRRAAQAVYVQAGAQYREVVLKAFQDVADTLRSLVADAAALKAQVGAEDATRDSLEMMRKQFAVGAVSYDLVLSADRQYQQALIGRIKAQAQRFYDSSALFQALGAGGESL